MEEGLISLRAVEPNDIDFLWELENDDRNWEVSNTRIPFSKNTLKNYLENIQDIYIDKQLRLVITVDQTPCGLMDWFDFDAFHQRAGLGILVKDQYRNQGIGARALGLAVEFSKKNLGLRLLFCNILAENESSISLFEGVGFLECGTKKNWHKSPNGDFKDEKMYQYNF